MQLSKPPPGVKTVATAQVSFASARGKQSRQAVSGFGSPVSSARSTAVVAAVLLSVAGVVLTSTILIDRAASPRPPAELAATPGEPLPAAPPVTHPTADAAVSEGKVLALPPLEPGGVRNITAPAAPRGPDLVKPALQSGVTPSAQDQARIAEQTTLKDAAAPEAPSDQPRDQLADQPADQPNASLLISYGHDYMARADVSAARLLYRRAADGGSALGAAALAASFDPVALDQRGLRGVRPDPEAALYWYRVAATLGNEEAEAQAKILAAWLRGAASREAP